MIPLLIHPSQSPFQIQRDLIASFDARQVKHKFHYDSPRQTRRWLHLHEAFSPARTDTDCQAAYQKAYEAGVKQLTKPHLHLVGLGCGGGKKEAELLRLAAPSIPSLKYTPTDVSTAMCTVAYEEAQKLRLPNLQLEPGVVWDMETTSDWGKPLPNEAIDEGTRCYTFFGMLPNFEPDLAFDRLSALLRPGDFLLASANLAPGANYLEGIHSVIGGYDNPLCHEWLRQILIDHEIDDAGTLRFQISSPRTLHKLRRIEAIFELQRDIRLDLEGQRVTAKAKTEILLFYSYRYQLKQIQTICRSKGLELLSTQSNPGQTEAVFLCRKESS